MFKLKGLFIASHMWEIAGRFALLGVNLSLPLSDY